MKLRYYLAIFAYCAVIFGLSSMSSPPKPDIEFSNMDKVAHFILYGGLAGLISIGLHRSGRPHAREVLLYAPVLIATLYGASDEFHQYFVPPRTMSFADLLADIAGATTAQALCRAYFLRWPPATSAQPHET